MPKRTAKRRAAQSAWHCARRRATAHPLELIGYKALLRLLRAECKRQTPLAVAKAWGVSRSYIYMLLNGRRKTRWLRETTAKRLEAFLTAEGVRALVGAA